MEDSLRGRAKPKKLRVRFPDGTLYCYSSVKETFLETLRKIGYQKLSKVKLEVCRLPMFSQNQYELYKDFMEPIGGGWYVNTQGDTYNKYVQLKNINDQLNLGLEIDLSEDFKGEKVARGSKGMAVLEVTFPDHTVISEENTNETFMQCIWHLGVDNVRKLNLKQGGKDLITSAKLYNGQVQVDVNRWLVVPGALKDKVKILRVISAMLHVKLDITSFSTNEGKSYKRIGSKSSHKQELKSAMPGKFKQGESVYNELHGQGKIIEYDESTRKYKVRFNIKYKDEPVEKQVRSVKEEYLSPISSVESRPIEKQIRKVKHNTSSSTIGNATKQEKKYTVKKQIVPQVKEHKETLLGVERSEQVPTVTKPVSSNATKAEILPQKRIDSKFNSGDIVYHKTFGKGIVRQFFSGTKTYKVRFYGNLPRSTQVVDEEDLSVKPLTQRPVIKKEEKPHPPIITDHSNPKSLEPEFKVGEKVFCKNYGEGVIIGFDYKKDKVAYIVKFALGTSTSKGSGKIVIVDGTELRKKTKNDKLL